MTWTYTDGNELGICIDGVNNLTSNAYIACYPGPSPLNLIAHKRDDGATTSPASYNSSINLENDWQRLRYAARDLGGGFGHGRVLCSISSRINELTVPQRHQHPTTLFETRRTTGNDQVYHNPSCSITPH